MINDFTSGLVEPLRQLPTAVIMASPDNAVLGAMIRLNAFASTDPDNNPLTYRWEFLAVPIGSVVVQEGFRQLDPSGVEVSFSPDIIGQYVVKLTISNGVYESDATQLVSVRAILVPHGRGIIPDGKFIWTYIRDVWQGVENKEIFETLWSALIQIAGGELLKTYQVDFNKSIRDIQDLYQRRWLNYDPKIELDGNVSMYFGNQLAGSGASTIPLGTQGKAVILHTDEVVIARGSLLSQVAGETFSVIYSTAQSNVGDYLVKTQNKSRNGYLLSDPVVDSMADVLTKREATPENPAPPGVEVIDGWCKEPVYVYFEFQSKTWTFMYAKRVDYALLMSKYPSNIDVYANLFSIESDAIPPGLRVGDVIHFEKGPNTGFYVVESISGNFITVDKAPPGASPFPDYTLQPPRGQPSYLVNIYHPVGFTLTQDEQVFTDTVSLPYTVSDKIGDLAKGRVITVNGQAYTLSRSYVDMNQSPPMEIVVTDHGELLANQSNFNWRVPYTLVSKTQNFEEMGVSPGDLLVAEVTSEVSQTSCEVRVQVVGATGYRLGFLLSTDALVPGEVSPIPEQLYVDLSENLGIRLAAWNRDGQLVITDDMKRILTTMGTTGFARSYLNREITPSTDINILGGIFRVRPKYIIRNSKIPVPDLLRSTPLLQEWVSQPELSEHDGKIFQTKNDKEYQLARRPTLLVENSDYLIDAEEVFKGEIFLDTGTKNVHIENGFFLDRGLASGDIFEITAPPSLARPYRIRDVVDQRNLKLTLAIQDVPLSRLPFVACKVRILRKASGRFLRFIPGLFGPTAPAPSRMWSEVSLFDNSDAIENNFGLLVGLTRADLDTVSQSINYRQAVAGLMFAYTRGPDVSKIRLGAQILLGLPFTEHDGIIRSVENDYRLDVYGNPITGRLLIEDIDSEGSPTGTLRVYTFPIDYQSTEMSGVETNPATGRAYDVDDKVPMFTALCKGIEVVDYVSNPLDFTASYRQKLQQFHSFKLRANDNIFNLAELTLVSAFLRKITPSYINYALQTTTALFDKVNIIDLPRMNFKILGGSGSTFADDVGTGLASPFMYDQTSYYGALFGYWGDGFYQPRRFGSDMTLVAGDSRAYTPKGGLLVPEFGEGPIAQTDDKLLIIGGPQAGMYTIGYIDNTLGNTSGDVISLLDAPYGGFKDASNLSFIILRPVKAMLRSGSLISNATDTVTMSEGGLRRDGVMPGDWLLLGSGEGSVEAPPYTIRDVREAEPGSGVWNVLVLDRPTRSNGSADYRIYRPHLICAPYMEDEIVINSNGPDGRHTVSNNWVRALMETGDEIVLTNGDPILTVRAVDTWYVYLDQTLPSVDGGGHVIFHRGYLKKRGHVGSPVGLDVKLLFPSDQVTVDLICGSPVRPMDDTRILVYATADDIANGTQTWHLNNTAAEATTPLPGDVLIITTGADALNDIGYGPGAFPIVAVTSDSSWIHLRTLGYQTAEGGQEYRIRRVLTKTPTFPLYELPEP